MQTTPAGVPVLWNKCSDCTARDLARCTLTPGSHRPSEGRAAAAPADAGHQDGSTAPDGDDAGKESQRKAKAPDRPAVPSGTLFKLATLEDWQVLIHLITNETIVQALPAAWAQVLRQMARKVSDG